MTKPATTLITTLKQAAHTAGELLREGDALTHGVVYQPLLDEMLWAVRSQGAFLSVMAGLFPPSEAAHTPHAAGVPPLPAGNRRRSSGGRKSPRCRPSVR